MRTLVVGAGAIGGYFGGRLLEINRDVTFLVRPKRAAELATHGLRIRSRFGDVTLANPATVLAENLRETFDLVLLSCKAYDLESAITSFAPAVGPDTVILPLLNGMRHLEILNERFGRERVLGGQCLIAAALTDGEIVHLNDTHELSFGEQNGALSDRVKAIATLMDGARVQGACQHGNPAGNVGEVGFPGFAGRQHLPDARRHRRYLRVSRWYRLHPWTAGRVPLDRSCRGLSHAGAHSWNEPATC